MKTRLTRHIILILAVIALLITAGCSTQKNTAKSRWWHSFNARYNTYYNGSLAYIDGSLEKETGNKDNFTEMIPLYTVGNKASRELGKANFDRAIEKSKKAIKMHSIKKRPEWTKSRKKTERDIEWLNRKEYNPFLWKAWMLMGRSQFMKGSFDEAASTFAYMSRLYSTQPAIYGRARAWLAKCYVEEGWLYDAEDVITKIRRDSLHWRAVKEWDYTYADYYIHSGRYAEAISYLRKVIRHEMRRKQKAREWFLMGQLQAAIGNSAEAYKSYKRVIRLNPPYQLEFNARISMTEVMAKGQSKKMIRKLRRMAASDNNKEYLDQVYYAIGNIYMNDRDTTSAIAAYEKGNEKSTRNGIEKGVLLLTLGDIYWAKEDYTNARRCYGEAIGLLDKERKDYKQLSERSKILDELVPYTETVHLQDSLQELARMPESERNEAIDRVIEALKKKEKEERRAQAEAEAAQNQNAQSGNNSLTNSNSTTTNTTDKSGTWYFYSPLAVSQGKTNFQKLWGKRENVDDWQRVNKTVVASFDNTEELTDAQRDSIAAAEAAEDSIKNSLDSAENNPHKREYYLKQIPFTPEQVAESNKLIEDGLYHSGVIFKDKLDNLTLSEKSLRRLTDNYTDYEHLDDAYYHLFLLYSRLHLKYKADAFLDSLKQKYPDSKWTTLLSDPYFEENSKFGVQIEDSLYAATYDAFNADRFGTVRANQELSASRFPLGANRDKFIFIGGLSKLNSGDSDGCLADMQEVVNKYPTSRVSEMAGMIINGVKAGRRLHGGKFDIGNVWEHRSEVLNEKDSASVRQFVAERNTNFSFLIAYSPDSLNENRLLFELARFNFSNFMVRNFDIVIDELDGLHRMTISGFKSYDEALQYTRQLFANEAVKQVAQKGRPIIISDSNLELLGTQYSYTDYDKFYEKHFVPLRISTVRLLTEPATIEYQPQPEEEPADDENSLSDGDELYNGGVIEQGLFIDDDQPAAQEGDDEQQNGSTEIAVPDEKATEQPVETPNDNTVVTPAEPEPQDEPQDDDTLVVPDEPEKKQEQPAIDIPSEGTEIPIKAEEKPQTEVIPNAVETEPDANESQATAPVEAEETSTEQPEPVEPQVKEPESATEEPEPEVKQPEPEPETPANNSEDDLIIEFNDDETGSGNINSNSRKDDKRQNSIELEDEYYDLEGF